MNCDCISRVEKDIADLMRQKAGDDAKATAVNIAFFIDSDHEFGSSLQIPFRVKGSKKGYTSERGKEVGCNVSFCPFCGKPANRKVPEGRDDGIEAAFAAKKCGAA